MHEKSELRRRAIISVVGTIGATLIFRLTAILDGAVDWPRTLVYALTGAIAGAVFGALARSESRTMRVVQIGAGALIIGAVFAMIAGAFNGPRFYWWEI